MLRYILYNTYIYYVQIIMLRYILYNTIHTYIYYVQIIMLRYEPFQNCVELQEVV